MLRLSLPWMRESLPWKTLKLLPQRAPKLCPLKNNPLLILLGSAVRHVVVTGLLLIMAFLGLPEELQGQVQQAADFTAPLVTAFLAWLLLKHGTTFLKQVGFLKVILILFSLSPLLLLASCTVTVDPVTGRPILSANSTDFLRTADLINQRLEERRLEREATEQAPAIEAPAK